jgi:hypothetical protein
VKVAALLETGCLLAIATLLVCGQEGPAAKGNPLAVKTAPGTIAAKVSVPDSVKLAGSGLVLRFEGVTFHGPRFVGLRLFLNKPGADASTPISDPAYLGSISPGHFDEKMTATGDFVLDVSTMKETARQTIAAALKSGELTVFCVPISRKNSEGASPSVSIMAVELKRRTDSN